MVKRTRLRKKLRNNPSDVSMQDVETLLTRYGFRLERVSGSHHIFEFDDGKVNRQIVVPLHGRKVKRIYIRKVIELLDELFPEKDAAEANESKPVDDGLEDEGTNGGQDT